MLFHGGHRSGVEDILDIQAWRAVEMKGVACPVSRADELGADIPFVGHLGLVV